MVRFYEFKMMALSFSKSEEKEHFGIPSFRYKNKIFATYHPREHLAMVKLNTIDQSVFCDISKGVFFPAQGAWGKAGSTYVKLELADKGMFLDALGLAYQGVSEKKKK